MYTKENPTWLLELPALHEQLGWPSKARVLNALNTKGRGVHRTNESNRMYTAQVRQQLLELQALREQLGSQSRQLGALKASYEQGLASAQESARTRGDQASQLSSRVSELEDALLTREKELASLQVGSLLIA